MVEFARAYIDSSVVVRRTLKQPGALHQVAWGIARSSELLRAELFRTVDRFRVTTGIIEVEATQLQTDAESNLAGIDLLPLDSEVSRRVAGRFPTPLGTLDAIHLATALMWYEQSGEPF